MSANVNVLLAFFIAVFVFTDGATGLQQHLAYVAQGRFYRIWENNWENPVNKVCRNSALTGIQSIHSDDFQDRRFNFACSKIYRCENDVNMRTTACYWTRSDNEQVDHHRCEDNHFIAGWKSAKIPRKKDRMMSIQCCLIPGLTLKDCMTTGPVHKYDHPIKYLAPQGYVIDQVLSVYSYSHKDRQFGFRICKAFFP